MRLAITTFTGLLRCIRTLSGLPFAAALRSTAGTTASSAGTGNDGPYHPGLCAACATHPMIVFCRRRMCVSWGGEGILCVC